METKLDKYQLCVLEGAQKGSRQILHTAQAQMVGTSFDCDIYLHDDNESAHQIQILPGRFSISITLVSGEAVFDSTPMIPGQKYKLSPGIPVRIGESLFTVETLTAEQTVVDASVTHPGLIEQDSDERLETDLQAGSPINDAIDFANTDTRLITRLYRPGFLVLLVGFGLIGAVLVAWMSGPVAVASVSVPAVQSNNLGAGLDPGHIAANETNESGRVDATAAVIENSVLDVFRSFGVTAAASSSQAGFVTVTTNSTDVKQLAAAEAFANADVYGLKKLIVDFDIPAIKNSETPKKVVRKPADQEIRMIVIGNPTYVVAADQERYFKGSKLPTGHRVADIRKGLVVVEKNGVKTELKL